MTLRERDTVETLHEAIGALQAAKRGVAHALVDIENMAERIDTLKDAVECTAEVRNTLDILVNTLREAADAIK